MHVEQHVRVFMLARVTVTVVSLMMSTAQASGRGPATVADLFDACTPVFAQPYTVPPKLGERVVVGNLVATRVRKDLTGYVRGSPIETEAMLVVATACVYLPGCLSPGLISPSDRFRTELVVNHPIEFVFRCSAHRRRGPVKVLLEQ